MGRSLLVCMLASLMLVSSVYAAKPDFIGKKYKLSHSQGFDEVMKALEIGFAKRLLANNVEPTVSLIENDGWYTLKTESLVKNHEIDFKLGQEFKQETIDGRENVKTIVTLEGNKLIEVQHGDKVLTTIREFYPDKMITTMKIDGITSTRTYEVEH